MVGDATMIGTIGELLAARAEGHPDRTIYSYLAHRDAAPDQLTAADLMGAATAVGSGLGDLTRPGDRVVLALPPGVDFIIALFACAHAGTVAVPTVALSPTAGKSGWTARDVAVDCAASVIVARPGTSSIGGLPTVSVDALAAAGAVGGDQVPRRPDDLAVLQYSSGSTARPKGVMVSHANLLANLLALQRRLDLVPTSQGVIWLPPYHDMGLVGGVFLPLFLGAHVTLMSPRQFAGKPLRWLDALADTGADHAAVPNFALDLCVRMTTEEERRELDLSALRTLLLGGEPVRTDSMRRFAEAFAVSGFEPGRFTGAYGLAENTLIVTATAPDLRPAVATICARSLADGTIAMPSDDAGALQIVSSGTPPPDTEVLVVDPIRRLELAAGHVGEVWVRGPCVAQGYWGQPERSRRIFGGELAGGPTGEPFLRTGDRGFVEQGELYITGRIDDLLIVNGVNHHAELLEHSLADAHPALRAGDSVALTLEHDGTSELVVVAAVARDHAADAHEIVRAVRATLAVSHRVVAQRVVLVQRRALPRTPNGKIQRDRCRRLLHEDSMPVLHEWRAVSSRQPARDAHSDAAFTVAELTARIVELTGIPVGDLDPNVALGSLGLDSLQLAELLVATEVELGSRIDLEDVLVDATIASLAARLGAVGPFARSHVVAPESDLAALPELVALRRRLDDLASAGIANPFERTVEDVSGTDVSIEGHALVDFASYNYLGLSGSTAVNDAACEAVGRYGTSASASRLAAGDRVVHRQLERGLAAFLGAEAALVFVSGNLTNVTVIGHLVGAGDLVVHDERIHDSVLSGVRLSGATRRSFPHNDWDVLERLLAATRSRYRRVLVVIEGLYSMDGDVPDLAEFVRVKERHDAFLMVDEAHSLGVLGATGRGIAEHHGVDRSAVEIWMGTLSKTLAGCGGYIAGSGSLVDYLRYSAPGYVFSVGLSPPDAAAALSALQQLDARPELVGMLRERSTRLLDLARRRGLPVPAGACAAIVPVIVGRSELALEFAASLFELGFNVLPMVHPAVPDGSARLRLFLRADHRPGDLDAVVEAIADLLGGEQLGPLASS